jgi:hypothetical protein
VQNHAGLNLLSCYKPIHEADEADQRLLPFHPSSPTGFIPPSRLVGGKTWGGGGACWVVDSWVERRLPPSRGGL